MIDGFDHVVMTATDLDATCRFYGDVLGARVDQDYVVDGRVVVRRVFVGRAMLNIHQAGNGVALVARHPTPGSLDLCFRLSGPLDEALERLAAANVTLIEGPVARTTCLDAPSQSVYFHDPDGNLIELMAETGAA